MFGYRLFIFRADIYNVTPGHNVKNITKFGVFAIFSYQYPVTYDMNGAFIWGYRMHTRLVWYTLFLFLILFGVLLPMSITTPFLQHPELGYDKLLHMMGGMGLGATGILLGQYTFGKALTRTHGTLFALAATTMIGIIAWEFWEWRWMYPKLGLDYSWIDAAGDAMFDLVGCVNAIMFLQRK